MLTGRNPGFSCGLTLGLASLASMVFFSDVEAQVKLGENPTAIATDGNLQIEATDGTQMLVRKSTARVGIGTVSPGNRLEVDGGTPNASGFRLTRLPNATSLSTNANGDIVRGPAPGAGCDCGDVKASFLANSHGPWKIMDGTVHTGSCGTFGIDARDALMLQGGAYTPGMTYVHAPFQLDISNLPPVILSGSTSKYYHYHGSRQGSPLQSGEIGLTMLSQVGAGTTVISLDSGLSGTEPDILNSPVPIPADTHSHTVSVELNSAPQSRPVVGVRRLPRVVVNYFVCVN